MPRRATKVLRTGGVLMWSLFVAILMVDRPVSSHQYYFYSAAFLFLALFEKLGNMCLLRPCHVRL